MSSHTTRRDVDTGLPKWVFTPKTFNPRPTWLKTPWTAVDRLRAADEELHQSILAHGEEAFDGHVKQVERTHVQKVRHVEAEMDKVIEKKMSDLRQLLESKFQKLVEVSIENGTEKLRRQLTERLVDESNKAAVRWVEEEEELEEEKERNLEEQMKKIEERKETEIEAKKVEAMGIWDGELERIRIFEEAKTRRIHREDMTELCEGIWSKMEYLRRRMEASNEAARRRGAAAYARDAALRRKLALEASGKNDDDDENDDDDDDEETSSELRRQKEKRDQQTKLMNLSAAAKQEIDRLKTAIGDVVKERRRAERNVGKVLEAFRRFADAGLGVVEKDLGTEDRLEFLLRDPVMFVKPTRGGGGGGEGGGRGGAEGGEGGGAETETEELRMVDGCANLWGWIKDWMVERVQGEMTRRRYREDNATGEEEEEEEAARQTEEGIEGESFDDEAVAKAVFDDLVRATIEGRGAATTDELLRRISSTILKAMLGEEAEQKIDEELEKRKRPPVKRGEWEMAATDCMDGGRVMW